MQEEELIRQIDEMHTHGWGGFVMELALACRPPYPSSAWIDRTATYVAEAKKRGMKAWLYDEDIYPSGFAGGLVTTKRPDYCMRVLVCREHGQLPASGLTRKGIRKPVCSARIFSGSHHSSHLDPR